MNGAGQRHGHEGRQNRATLKGHEEGEPPGRRTGHGKNGFPVPILEVSREGSAEARALPGAIPESGCGAGGQALGATPDPGVPP